MSSRFYSGYSRLWRCVFFSAVLAFFVNGAWLNSSASQDPPMPDGPGKAEARKLCAGCHELEKSFSMKLDRPGWQGVLEKMVSFGMKGTDQEINTLLEYLVKNYPADDVPRIKVNEAAAIDFESILSLKRSQAAALIRYREKNGKFKSIEDLKKVPGIDAVKVEAKKDRLIFE